jgi:hypothetical protein
VWLSSVKATVRVVGGWLAEFWDPWYPGVAEVVVVVGRIGYAEVIVADDEGCCCVVEVVAGNEECGCAMVAEGGWF